MLIGGSSLGDLARLRHGLRRMRVSSWDLSGGNDDFWTLGPGEARTIADLAGAGCIRHIWMTMESHEPAWPRQIVLRMWWEGEASPSVEAPIGDFFGIGHGIVKTFSSLPLQMSPEDGRAFNCWFPMPFASRARIEVSNDSPADCILYFYVDYEAYAPDGAAEVSQEYGRFHAQWRCQNPADGWADLSRRGDREWLAQAWRTPNLDGAGNYVILEATGKGHYVGCHLDIDCFQRELCDWYGEGDDMIFVDGEPWPPRLHGTGTEDYVNLAYGPTQEHYGPYHGLTVYSGSKEWPWGGKNSVYRYHIEDPIYFEKSIRVTVEHGHANEQSNDYSSTAYWYQTEPHAPFEPLLPVALRLPRPDR
jgi:hypothetical protein